MSHSNSSLNTFAACMKKYEHQYILHSPRCLPESPHLLFGTMAHEVLYKAGAIKDGTFDFGDTEIDENVDKCETFAIPSEVLYGDLKETFNISTWKQYFKPIIKQVYKYEEELRASFKGDEEICVERELKLQITVEQLESLGYVGITQPLVGVIDLLLFTKTEAVIIDYKFSSKQKTQDDFDMNSQLPLYAFLVHYLYDIPIHNIRYGYIDIPKTMFTMPEVLKNGTLSRAKSQNVSAYLYKKAVIALHGNDDYYNCEPGGYYYDAYCSFALNKCAYMNVQYIDIEAYRYIVGDLLQTAYMIDTMSANDLYFLRKYDSYTCANCEYKLACKPWLGVK